MIRQLFLIRHAQPEHPFDGRYDLPPGPGLSLEGRAQADALGRFLAHARLAGLHHSPFLRTLQTAAVIGNHLGLPSREAPELREWERGEAPEALQERIAAFWDATIVGASHSLALVSHGSPLEALLRHATGGQIDLSGHRYWGGAAVPLGGAWLLESAGVDEAWEARLIYDPAAVETA